VNIKRYLQNCPQAYYLTGNERNVGVTYQFAFKEIDILHMNRVQVTNAYTPAS